MMAYLYILLITIIIGFVNCQECPKQKPPSKEDQEDEHSNFISDNLKCDACTAVAYKMKEALDNEAKKKGGKKLFESDYLDAFGKVCKKDAFKDYGVQKDGEVRRLFGKGLEYEDADSATGMVMGGGKWHERMETKCFEYIDEVGEDEIYNRYWDKQNLKEYLCHQITTDCVDSSKKEL